MTEAGLAVAGTLKVPEVTVKLVKGDGNEAGVLESRLTVPVKDAVELKKLSRDRSCASVLFTEASYVTILASIFENKKILSISYRSFIN